MKMTELNDLRPSNTPLMQPNTLVEGLPARIVSSADREISGVTLDSSDVAPGDLFVAIPGFRRHGAEFAHQAVEAGACAVATDRRGIELLGDLTNISIIEVEDPRAFAGLAAAKVYGNPGESMRVVGVTGTNGKTTTTHFIRHALEQMTGSTLLIGTVGVALGAVHAGSKRTSLEAPVLHRILAWALERGAKNVVMEVSSHALSLHRVAGLEFDVATFLNLQRDHLDFHKTMENYFAAKAKLFERGSAKRAVICVDDEWGKRLASSIETPIATVSTLRHADFEVASHSLNAVDAGTDVHLSTPSGGLTMHCPLPGMINVQNQLNALATLTTLGLDTFEAAEVLACTPGVPGRMEVVAKRSDTNPLVIVDFAHTPDAIAAACEAVDPVTPGNLWLLFGATGERDRGKRPVMGEIAAQSADRVIVTDDDVYGEDPAQIRAEVAAGFKHAKCRAGELYESDDRALAIREAVLAATPSDTVLIAGRGHEKIQQIGDTANVLDDRDEARAAIELRKRRASEPSGAANTLLTMRRLPQTCEDLQ